MSHGTSCSWFQPVKAWLWHTYTEKLVSDQGIVTQLGRCNYPFKGWKTRQGNFLAYQNQHVSKPTWVKWQCNGHSRSGLKSKLKMAKLPPSENHLWRIISRAWWLGNGQALKIPSWGCPNIWGISPPLTHSWGCTQALRMGLEWQHLFQVCQTKREPCLADIARKSQGMHVTYYNDHAKE